MTTTDLPLTGAATGTFFAAWFLTVAGDFLDGLALRATGMRLLVTVLLGDWMADGVCEIGGGL